MNVQEKFATTRRELSGALIERDSEVDLCLTAMIAQEHALLVGPPGTGKSMLADAIVRWMAGRKYQILLTKFSTPEEVFGPVSLAGLKSDRYARVIAGKLPDCEIAFIDEIFKASSAILNTLLTILNERRFDNDGARISCPLKLCVSASNEWPGDGDNGKELGALFDRFVLRKHVNPIRTAAGIDRLLWDDLNVTLTTTITPAEIDQAAIDAAALPWTDLAKETFMAILREAKAEGIVPGDRRLRKSIKVVQAYGYLCGAHQVEREHLEILSHVLWDDPAEQPMKLAKIVGRLANPASVKVASLRLEAEEILATTNPRNLVEAGAAWTKLEEIHGQMTILTGDKAAAAAGWLTTEIRNLKIAAME